MTATVVIAPVRKSIRVKANQAHAFDVVASHVFHAGERKPLAIIAPRLKGVDREIGTERFGKSHEGLRKPE